MKKSIFTIGFALLSMIAIQSCQNGGETGNNTDQQNMEDQNTTDTRNGENRESEEHMEDTDMVESGTYTGTAERVVPEREEIYMRTDDNQLLEFYFTDNTKLREQGEEVAFTRIQEGQRVEVEVTNEGDRLIPERVTLIQNEEK